MNLKLLMAALPFTIACAGLGQESYLISEEQEISMGAEFHQQMLEQMPAFQGDPKVLQYVKDLGSRIAPHTDRPGLSYTFTVVESDEINAFAVMGGYVYLTTGLLKSATSGAEVASVLAHEMGHISARHGVRAMETYLVTQGIVSLIGKNDWSDIVSGALDIGSGLLFSQDQEREADYLGVQYALASQFNPWGMVDFFQYLQTLEGSSTDGGILTGLGELFSTHPPTSERIQSVADQLSSMGIANNSPDLAWESDISLSEITKLLK
ncbi:MAG: M48 family metalloprotease [Deltaproteobacteria bacterium]|nr:M48 family metalloprotease [Deltaproteobacteria bacterium]